jgi:long-subunit fatty acid transport protein
MNRRVLIAAVLFSAGSAHAQSAAPEVGFSSIPFQFFPPGARSLAMGATFIGVADDATAAASNPAGLIILTKPEVSFHGRVTHFHEEQSGGYSSASVSAWSPSYTSLVMPLKPFSFSAYYQQVSKIDLERRFDGKVLFPGESELTPFRSTSSIDLLVSDLGLSGGVRVASKLSLGLTMARRKMQLGYRNGNTINAAFSDRASADGSDHDIVFSAGVLANPNGRLSAGFVYKRGGSFRIPYLVDFEGSVSGPVSCPRVAICEAGAIRIPDTWGAGAGFRPTDQWLFSADASLIKYSQLSTTIFRAIPFDIYPIPSPTNELPPSRFKDVVQLHAGVERIHRGSTTVLFRGGFYHRPDFNKDGGVDAGASFVTGGLGLVFGDRGQLDLAASVSSGVSEGLASVVVRF